MCEIQKLLHSKGKDQESLQISNRMGKDICALHPWIWLIYRVYQQLKKLNNKVTQTIQLRNLQIIWVESSQKKKFKLPTNICENVQHHYLSWKCKSKPMRYHFTPVRMILIQKSEKNKWWWGCGEKKKKKLIKCW